MPDTSPYEQLAAAHPEASDALLSGNPERAREAALDIQQQEFMETAALAIRSVQDYLGDHVLNIPESTLQLLAAENATASALLRVLGTLRTLAHVDEDVKAAVQAAFVDNLDQMPYVDVAVADDWEALVTYISEHHVVRPAEEA